MTEIQQADLQLRRRILWLLAFVILVIALLTLGLRPYGQQLTADFVGQMLRLADQPFLFLVLGLLFVAPLLILALYLFRYGTAVIGGERLPPKEHGVIRDTMVLTGAPARRRGRVAQYGAIVLIALALAIPVLFLQMIRSIT
ncbi:MAG: hypothetical protein ACR2PZ_05485 [Pseudomonadales bacterium]